ncbi:MAG: helical backbone metal receptor [Brevinematales bacterium]|jgi:iron complex transport system substrate-binding protein
MPRFYLLFLFLIFFTQSFYPSSLPSFQRIISLSPLLTEEIFILGSDRDLIADTIYCVNPEGAKYKPKIGNMTDIDVEKIFSLRPDLILASGLTEPEQLDKLKSLKIRVEIFNQPGNFNEICAQLFRLAKLLGREEKANLITDEARKSVSALSSAASRYSKKRVFVEIGSNPLFTVGSGSFINDFIVMAGGINVAVNSGTGLYSLETVIRDDPEVIIISDMGMNVPDEKNYWLKFKTISAVRNNAIYSIDSYSLCSPTPADFPLTLEKLIRLIHPESGEKGSLR